MRVPKPARSRYDLGMSDGSSGSGVNKWIIFLVILAAFNAAAYYFQWDWYIF